LEITRRIGDRQGEADSLIDLGDAYKSLGEYQRAIDFYQQSLEIQRQIGDRNGEATSLIGLGNAYYSLGEYQRAIDFQQQSLEITRQIGDRNGEAISLFNLADTFAKLGRQPEALQHYHESRQLFHAMALSQDVQDCDDRILSLESSNWFTRFTHFSQRGKWQRVLFFGVSIVAFPFALVGLVVLLAWRTVRGWVRRK
jgi:tetratricopeptide (TPR) repeat protein